MKKFTFILSIAIVLGFANIGNATFYTITDLGDLGGGFSVADSINEQGQVFGFTKTTGGEFVSFIWDSNQGMQIYTGNIYDLKKVNDSGQRISSPFHPVTGIRTANIDDTWLALPDG